MTEKYEPHELDPFLGCVAAGYPVDRAMQLSGLDIDRLNFTYNRDTDLRGWVLDLSMWANEKIREGTLPPPPRDDNYYADVGWEIFYHHTVLKDK